NFLLAVVGDLNLGNTYAAGDLSLTAGGSLTIGDVTALGGLSLNAGTNLIAGNLDAQGNVALSATGNVAGGAVNAGGGFAADAGGNLTLGTIATNSFNPPSGFAIRPGTSAATVTGQDVTLSSGGNLTTESITSAGAIGLTAGGTLGTGDLSAATDITANSVGTMTLGNAQAGSNVTLASSGGDVTTANVGGKVVNVSATGTTSVNAVTASTSASFTAGGLANFYGVVASPTITVTSGDLNVANGGSLGVWGLTNLLTLNAMSNGSPVIIGSGISSTAGQYVLNEDGNINSAAVVVNALSATGGSAPDILIGSLSIDGSQSPDGGVSSVTVNTGGTIVVQGNVQVSDAGAADTLTLNGGHAVEVITDTGSIAMTNSSGALAGVLGLNADNVWVGNQALITQLEADPNFAGRDAALATNSGPVNSAGYVQAGQVDSTVSNTFLVQNSGDSTNFAGITVGDGGLNVTGSGPSPTTVIIYGQQVKSDGTVNGGDQFASAVAISSPSGTATDSAINGCPLGGCVIVPPVPVIPGGGPGIESILGPIGLMGGSGFAGDSQGSVDGSDDGEGDDSDDSDDNSGDQVDVLFSLINTAPIVLDQPVDEPVTSGSDGAGPGGL
ncbi:MAG: hypothetical protein QFB89_01645, partial [Pseudomonadota bacterium]|nr:hypothetical protein [Pseudomonadota bacterium]